MRSARPHRHARVSSIPALSGGLIREAYHHHVEVKWAFSDCPFSRGMVRSGCLCLKIRQACQIKPQLLRYGRLRCALDIQGTGWGVHPVRARLCLVSQCRTGTHSSKSLRCGPRWVGGPGSVCLLHHNDQRGFHWRWLCSGFGTHGLCVGTVGLREYAWGCGGNHLSVQGRPGVLVVGGPGSMKCAHVWWCL